MFASTCGLAPHVSAELNLLDGRVVFSGEGTGKVPTLRESRKGTQRTLACAVGTTSEVRSRLLGTDPLNAGVTTGDATAFLNFSRALTQARHGRAGGRSG